MIELHEVAPEYGFLLERGLRIGARTPGASTLGDRALELTGAGVSFRFAEEAGRVAVAVRGPASSWFALGDVLDFLGTRTSASEHARVVEARWREIAALFGDEMRVADLQDHVASVRADRRHGPGPIPS